MKRLIDYIVEDGEITFKRFRDFMNHFRGICTDRFTMPMEDIIFTLDNDGGEGAKSIDEGVWKILDEIRNDETAGYKIDYDRLKAKFTARQLLIDNVEMLYDEYI